MVSLDVQLGCGVGFSLWFCDVLCGFLCGCLQELTKNDPAAEAACRGLGSWSGNANGGPHLNPAHVICSERYARHVL